MKRILLPLILTACAAPLFAQTPQGAGAGNPAGQAPSLQTGAARPVAPQISPELRQQLRAAEEAASKTPEVIAAKQALMEASKNLKAAVQAAMVKADPSLSDFLAKMGPPPRLRGDGMPGDQRPRGRDAGAKTPGGQ